MKNLQPYLLPAAVLVLALTQVPTMQRSILFNRCVSEAYKYRSDKWPTHPYGMEQEKHLMPMNYCNGGTGNPQ